MQCNNDYKTFSPSSSNGRLLFEIRQQSMKRIYSWLVMEVNTNWSCSNYLQFILHGWIRKTFAQTAQNTWGVLCFEQFKQMQCICCLPCFRFWTNADLILRNEENEKIKKFYKINEKQTELLSWKGSKEIYLEMEWRLLN